MNTKHPRVLYFQLLTDSLKKVRSGKHFKKMLDPYLNAPSDGEQDLSSEDEEKGCSPQLFTLPRDKDTIMENWDDKGNKPDSHAYKNYGY